MHTVFRRQPSAVPAATLEAYRNARYVVQAPAGDIELRVGQPSPALDRLLEIHDTSGAVLITAYNPHGEPQPEATNRAAQQRLLAELEHRRCRLIPGFGEDPQGRWTREHSVLVLGLAAGEADALGETFGQNAYLRCEAGQPPCLVVLR